MSDKTLFFEDPVSGPLSWEALLQQGFGSAPPFVPVLQTRDAGRVFWSTLQAFYFERDLILLDDDLADGATNQCLHEDEARQLNQPVTLQQESPCPSADALIRKVQQSTRATLTLFTSGTTGRPVRVTHTLNTLTKGIRRSEKLEDAIWGLAYNPTHIAGIQVFLQAALNQNPLIHLFGLPREAVFRRIEQYAISHLSATPTFYRLLLPVEKAFPSVERISTGGEKYDPGLGKSLRQMFPRAKLLNIYASTEAGTLLVADGEVFTIPPEDADRIAIRDGQLWVRNRDLGRFDFQEAWYPTGDQVDILSEKPLRFRFLQRADEAINVGGEKVNPHEVEVALRAHPDIREARVTARPNSVTGNILVADVVPARDALDEPAIRIFLEKRLPPYKIPRILQSVDSIPMTRTGKLQR